MKKNSVKIQKERCKECGLCIVECKSKILVISEEVNKKGYHPAKVVDPEKCTGCTLCAIACPEAIIEIEQIED